MVLWHTNSQHRPLSCWQQKADIWSCGVILYAMLYGCYPFSNKEPDYIRKIVTATYHMPPDVQVPKLSRLFMCCLCLLPFQGSQSCPVASRVPSSAKAAAVSCHLSCYVLAQQHTLSLPGLRLHAGVSRVQGPAYAAAGGRQRAAPQHGGHQEPLLVHPRAAQRRHPDERLVHARGQRHQRGTCP